MPVVIRHLSVRFKDLSDIRILHLTVTDDHESPLGAVFETHLPKCKVDILGTSGGADSELVHLPISPLFEALTKIVVSCSASLSTVVQRLYVPRLDAFILAVGLPPLH